MEPQKMDIDGDETPDNIEVVYQQGLHDSSHLIAPAEPYQSSSKPKEHTPGSTVPDPNSVWENGRSYTGYREGKYFFPNDAEEQDRLDFNHAIFVRLLNGSLSWAPIEEPLHVLDVGTGTGIWALEFAEQHPSSRVIGTDLSLIQPQGKPANCDFIRDDIEESWVFDHPFDYVHLRLMVSCFNDHKGVMKTIFDNLNPGGWVEYQDTIFDVGAIDDTLRGTAFHDWLQLMQRAGANLGRDFNVAKKYKEWMEEVGFVDVEERVVLNPGNPWPVDGEQKHMGKYQAVASSIAIPGFSLKVLQKGLGMSVEEINALVPGVQRSINDRNVHWYAIYYVVYGRKPHAGEVLREEVLPTSPIVT